MSHSTSRRSRLPYASRRRKHRIVHERGRSIVSRQPHASRRSLHRIINAPEAQLGRSAAFACTTATGVQSLCSDLYLTHTLTHLYILHYNLVPVFSPNSPTHFSFSLVSHPFLLSFLYWFLWPRGNQQTCALCVKMCSPGFVLVWSDLVLQHW